MARGDYPSAKQDQFMVRFPNGMRDRIKAAAEANNRSMNAEIVAALEEKYPAPLEPSDEIDVTDAIQTIRDLIQEHGPSEYLEGLLQKTIELKEGMEMGRRLGVFERYGSTKVKIELRVEDKDEK